jgi:hypothetical protein
MVFLLDMLSDEVILRSGAARSEIETHATRWEEQLRASSVGKAGIHSLRELNDVAFGDELGRVIVLQCRSPGPMSGAG